MIIEEKLSYNLNCLSQCSFSHVASITTTTTIQYHICWYISEQPFTICQLQWLVTLWNIKAK